MVICISCFVQSMTSVTLGFSIPADVFFLTPPLDVRSLKNNPNVSWWVLFMFLCSI